MKKVLIAGGAGFLGTTLVNTLLTNNHKVVVLDTLRFGAKALSKFNNHKNFTFQYGDITNENDVEKAIGSCDYVIALAAIVGDMACNADPKLTGKINTEGNQILINKSIEHNIERFIFASSCSVYGQSSQMNLTETMKLNPISLYAESQVSTEESLMKLKDKLDLTILRLSTLYGLSERRRFDLVLNFFASKITAEQEIEIIGGKQWRPFLHVKDAARAFHKVLDADSKDVVGQTFNVGGNDCNHQLIEIGQMIGEKIPAANIKLTDAKSDSRSYHVNFDKIEKAINFKPEIDIIDGIVEMMEDIQNNDIDITDINCHNGKSWQNFINNSYIPFAVPDVSIEEKNEILNTIDSGWLSSGPKVVKFEEALHNYFDTEDLHCITVSSCTAALHLQLLANDIGPGDEVITCVNTFSSTVIAILQCGATPVLVDIDSDNCNLDLNEVKDKISSKTKAVIPIYYAGNPCNHYQLKEICEKNGILILADAAHAFGGTFDGMKIGTYEDAASFSFYATKNLTTGEGGLITTRNKKLADRIRKMRSFGRSSIEGKPSYLYTISEEGYKYNFTDLQASFGLHQLKKIDSFNTYRAEIVNYYNEAFKDSPFLVTPNSSELGKSTHHLYPLQIQFDKLPIDRLEFIKIMSQKKIGLSVHYVPIHHHSYFQQKLKITEKDFYHCNEFRKQEVSIPIYTKLDKDDLNRISQSVIDTIDFYS